MNNCASSPPTATATPTVSPTPTSTTPTGPADGDLSAQVANFWVAPQQPYANEPSTQLGLTVIHFNGKQSLSNIVVRFYQGDPQQGGTLIGESSIPFLAARDPGQNTIPIAWTPPPVGEITLYAVIDPDNRIAETEETNNTLSRTVTVRTPQGDTAAPLVESFSINEGATTTFTTTVKLTTRASDPQQPASGLSSIAYVEQIYNELVGQWVPIKAVEWLPFTGSPLTTSWQLDPNPGLRYIQVWVADQAGNIALVPGSASISYLPPIGQVAARTTRLYRVTLAQGEHLIANLVPISGDPDLYVWGPDNTLAGHSNSADSVDAVDFVAKTAGVYQIEVHGYTAATYTLTIQTLSAAASAQQHVTGQPQLAKTLPTAPLIPVTNGPMGTVNLPPPTVPTRHHMYVPVVAR